MFGLNSEAKNNAAFVKALNQSLAIIEFDPKGNSPLGQRQFLPLARLCARGDRRQTSLDLRRPRLRAQRSDYREFWAKLGRGEFDAREYKRIGKGGAEVWIQASYNPVLDAKGVVRRVVKVATDITAAEAEKRRVRSQDERRFRSPRR